MNGLIYPIDIVNGSGETMPSFSIMRLATGSAETNNGRKFAPITKPDGEGSLWFVNGPASIADGETGKAASPMMPVWVKYYDTAPSEGDQVGPVDGQWAVSTEGTGLLVMHVDTTNRLVYAQSPGGGACQYYHEIWIDKNPGTGSAELDYTFDSDDETITVDWDMTAAELETEWLAEFSGMTADDLEVTGGPLPNFSLYVLWKGSAATKIEYPPTLGTVTFDDNATIKVREINPRGN